MRKNTNSSIDGFVPRRPDARFDHARALAQRQRQQSSQGARRTLDMDTTKKQASPLGDTHRFAKKNTTGDTGLSRTHIDEALKSIDTPPEVGKKKLLRRRSKRVKGGGSRRKAITKRIIIAVIVLLVAIGAIIGIRALIAGNNIFGGNLLGILKQEPLKVDANGRSNILVFGTAEDSEGGQHEGGNLTDSIMVLSIHQEKKDAYMLSLPRDLWVQYENTCTVGNEGKINAVYFCASNDGQDEDAGARALQRKASEVTGLDIQYYAHVNFTVVVEAVDAVGGVDVTIETDDPRGILDRNFDWKCNYQCYYVNYEQGERAHMDGEHALAFIRARNAQGGYGLAGGNFDREQNQQKVIVALRDKALGAGTLANPSAVIGLIDAMGNNLRTSFEVNEVRTLMSLAQDISTDKIESLTLVDEDEPLVTTGTYYGQSIVRPVAGLFSYSDIHTYVRENVAATPMTREKAGIMVLNGTSTVGLATRQAEELGQKGFKVVEIGNAPEGSYASVEVYQIATDKPATAKALRDLYGAELKTSTPPLQVGEAVDFVVIYGREPAANN